MTLAYRRTSVRGMVALSSCAIACGTEPEQIPEARLFVAPDTVQATFQTHINTLGDTVDHRLRYTLSFVVYNLGAVALTYFFDGCSYQLGRMVGTEWQGAHRTSCFFFRENIVDLDPGETRVHTVSAFHHVGGAAPSWDADPIEGAYQLRLLIFRTNPPGPDMALTSNPVVLRVEHLEPQDDSKGFRRRS